MKSRGAAVLMVMGIFIVWLVPDGVPAQTSSPASNSAASSGLTANVVGIAYNKDYLSAQIIIKNTNNLRVYIQDAQNDSSQYGFLGSGAVLGEPLVDGLPSCNATYAECVAQPINTDINRFSYIDPGNTLGVALHYRPGQPPSNPDTLSFSLTMIARLAKSDADNAPGDAGPAREITLAFPFLSFSQEK